MNLSDVIRYGEILEDYDFEDKNKGFMRTRIISYENQKYTLVMVNGKVISMGLSCI